MKYFIAAMIGIWVFFVGVMLCPANAQDAVPPMIEGVISFMYEDGTIETIHGTSAFNTVEECYAAGREAVVTFLPQIPLVIGHVIRCAPMGHDV